MTSKGSGKLLVSIKHSWTPQKLQKLATDNLTGLKARAAKLGVPDLESMCDAVLEDRAKVKAESITSQKGRVVTEFHFVCAKGKGVIEEGDGSFRSGS